jgi:hypothetical protein
MALPSSAGIRSKSIHALLIPLLSRQIIAILIKMRDTEEGS